MIQGVVSTITTRRDCIPYVGHDVIITNRGGVMAAGITWIDLDLQNPECRRHKRKILILS